MASTVQFTFDTKNPTVQYLLQLIVKSNILPVICDLNMLLRMIILLQCLFRLSEFFEKSD